MHIVLLQFLSFILALINQQGDRDFRKREAATAALNDIGMVYNIRPTLNQVIKSDKYHTEIKRRCSLVKDNIIRKQLHNFENNKYNIHPSQHPQRQYFITDKLPGQKFYHEYEIENAIRQEYYKIGDYEWRHNLSEYYTMHNEPKPLAQYIEEQYTETRSEEAVLDDLVSRVIYTYRLKQSYCRPPNKQR